MRIHALAARAGVAPSTVRYYEQIGLLPPPRREPNGYRVYDEEDLERLRFVVRARALDFTLDEIREILALRERGEPPCDYVRDRIGSRLEAIEARIEELRRLQQELTRLHRLAAQVLEAEPSAAGSAGICRIIEPPAVEASPVVHPDRPPSQVETPR